MRSLPCLCGRRATLNWLWPLRLIRFLDYFLPVMDIDVIPSTSIIREFVGGSYFTY